MVDRGTSAQGSPFWRFSLGFYRRPGVADACIALQDQCGVDVNLLLFLLWLASLRRRLSVAEVRSVSDRVRGWHSGVVAPLRELRRKLKQEHSLVEAGTAELFRTKIKGLELEAERLQQEASYELSQHQLLGEPAVAPEEAARANIAALQGVMGRDLPTAALDFLVSALLNSKA